MIGKKIAVPTLPKKNRPSKRREAGNMIEKKMTVPDRGTDGFKINYL